MINDNIKIIFIYCRVAPERPSNSAIARTIEDTPSPRDPPSYETAIRCLEIETEL